MVVIEDIARIEGLEIFGSAWLEYGSVTDQGLDFGQFFEVSLKSTVDIVCSR